MGNWIGIYGADGYVVSQDNNVKIPGYARLSATGLSNLVWAASTAALPALQKPGMAGSRIAGAWYASNNFTADLNLIDGNSHQIAVYALDWDSSARGETIKVLDASSGAVLDSRTLSAGSFHNGEYLIWTVQGHVKFEVGLNAGANVVVSGLLFDGAQKIQGSVTPAAPVAPITTPLNATGANVQAAQSSQKVGSNVSVSSPPLSTSQAAGVCSP